MTTSGNNPTKRKKLFERSSDPVAIKLTKRDQALLMQLLEYRVMDTNQIARAFFPPDIVAGLTYWGVPTDEARTLAAIDGGDQQLAAFKWARYLYRLQHKSRLTKAEQRSLTWLQALEQHHSQQYNELSAYIQQVGQTEPAAWLRQAITQQQAIPQAFHQRPAADQDKPSRACTARLRKLYDAGYLEKKELPTLSSEGKSPTLWFVSQAARDDIATVLGKKPTEIARMGFRQVGSATLQHTLATNDIRLAISLAATRLGYALLEWRDDFTLRRFHSRASERVTLTLHNKEVTFGVVPDGFFVLEVAEQKRGYFFVECDMGTVVEQYSQQGLKDWRRKVLGYGEYYRTRYAEAYPEAGKSLRILTVTTSQKRLENLKRVTHDKAKGGAHRYYFTTFERLQQGSPLTDPIWERADKEGLYSLVS